MTGLIHLLSDRSLLQLMDEVTYTECTEEQDERLAELAKKSADLDGSTGKGIEFTVRVEQLIAEYRDLYGQWLSVDQEKTDTAIYM